MTPRYFAPLVIAVVLCVQFFGIAPALLAQEHDEQYSAAAKAVLLSIQIARSDYEKGRNEADLFITNGCTLRVESAKRRGDLEGLDKWTKAREQFEKEGFLPSEVDMPQDIARFRSLRASAFTKLKNVYQKNISKLTRSSEIDVAMKLRRELTVLTCSEYAPDAVESEGNYYKYFSGKISWSDAKAACEQIGGHLVSIGSDGERQFITKLTSGNSAWIGATDQAQEGIFRWLDGSLVDMGLLEGLAGDNRPNRDFVHLSINGQFFARIESGHDSSRVQKDVQGFICEWEGLADPGQ